MTGVVIAWIVFIFIHEKETTRLPPVTFLIGNTALVTHTHTYMKVPITHYIRFLFSQ